MILELVAQFEVNVFEVWRATRSTVMSNELCIRSNVLKMIFFYWGRVLVVHLSWANPFHSFINVIDWILVNLVVVEVLILVYICTIIGSSKSCYYRYRSTSKDIVISYCCILLSVCNTFYSSWLLLRSSVTLVTYYTVSCWYVWVPFKVLVFGSCRIFDCGILLFSCCCCCVLVQVVTLCSLLNDWTLEWYVAVLYIICLN